ncbi:hypothetical protein Pmani_027650 [Petrolisthes manimaculis]|uniref:Complex 1 LYR protein domain-containing protein n=1 Tax=Petrolisthes manimaculis TaxID=1843537 RepID=A0AAE1P1P1_9EUCA|nr:hypothetical protein Pmani_027650 [Petrolisthes manimaculis]
MSAPTRRQVLQLYRALLQYGQTLELTDTQYYQQRVRKEFDANRTLTDERKTQYYFEKGLVFLSKQRLV